jgi:hypothetical protein
MIIKGNNGNANNHTATLDNLNDLDGEESALHEFDFLSGDASNISTPSINGEIRIENVRPTSRSSF